MLGFGICNYMGSSFSNIQLSKASCYLFCSIFGSLFVSVESCFLLRFGFLKCIFPICLFFVVLFFFTKKIIEKVLRKKDFQVSWIVINMSMIIVSGSVSIIYIHALLI